MSRLTAVLLLALVATAVFAQVPPRSISAPKSEVDDDFIAYLHGLIYRDREIRIDGATLKERFPEFDTPRHSPFDDITQMTRLRNAGTNSNHQAVITIEFEVPLQHTVEAVNILGMRPVQLLGSDRIVGAEEHVRPGSGALSDLMEASGVRDLAVLRITDGFMRVDFAGWLDFILGPFVDDVDVKLIAIARYDDNWYGMLGGTNPAGHPKTGIIDLSTSKFLLSPPQSLAELAVELIRDTLD